MNLQVLVRRTSNAMASPPGCSPLPAASKSDYNYFQTSSRLELGQIRTLLLLFQFKYTTIPRENQGIYDTLVE
jgi:hypothetical protein